jgi:hypothetical protein
MAQAQPRLTIPSCNPVAKFQTTASLPHPAKSHENQEIARPDAAFPHSDGRVSPSAIATNWVN